MRRSALKRAQTAPTAGPGLPNGEPAEKEAPWPHTVYEMDGQWDRVEICTDPRLELDSVGRLELDAKERQDMHEQASQG
jgi:hypothetical protein